MAVLTLLPKLKIMADKETATIFTVTKNTMVSLGLALAIAAGYGVNEVRHANVLNELRNLKRSFSEQKVEVQQIEKEYVSKEELKYTLDLINQELRAINEKISNKKK